MLGAGRARYGQMSNGCWLTSACWLATVAGWNTCILGDAYVQTLETRVVVYGWRTPYYTATPRSAMSRIEADVVLLGTADVQRERVVFCRVGLSGARDPQ